MKALTLWQPWATLMAIGAKQIETRGWYTDYRGPLAIHAALNFPREARELCWQEPFVSVLQGAGYDNPEELPTGVVVCTCRLIGVVRMDMTVIGSVSDEERVFGEYAPGRYAWYTSDCRRVDDPIPARGGRGLWDWNGENGRG